jgi:hypothetical protein
MSLRTFNLPPGVTTKDVEPEDIDDMVERLEREEEERYEHRRDSEMFEAKD